MRCVRPIFVIVGEALASLAASASRSARTAGHEPTAELEHGGDVHRRREGVVGGLRAVHVIVRDGPGPWTRARRRRARSHGSRSPRSRSCSSGSRSRSARPGAGTPRRASPPRPRRQPRSMSRARRSSRRPSSRFTSRARRLQHAKGMDDGRGHRVVADGEVMEAALGLRAPVVLGRHLDRAHRVGLGPRRHDVPSLLRRRARLRGLRRPRSPSRASWLHALVAVTVFVSAPSSSRRGTVFVRRLRRGGCLLRGPALRGASLGGRRLLRCNWLRGSARAAPSSVGASAHREPQCEDLARRRHVAVRAGHLPSPGTSSRAAVRLRGRGDRGARRDPPRPIVPLADVLVAVTVRPEGHLRVVEVHAAETLEAESRLDLVDHCVGELDASSSPPRSPTGAGCRRRCRGARRAGAVDHAAASSSNVRPTVPPEPAAFSSRIGHGGASGSFGSSASSSARSSAPVDPARRRPRCLRPCGSRRAARAPTRRGPVRPRGCCVRHATLFSKWCLSTCSEVDEVGRVAERDADRGVRTCGVAIARQGRPASTASASTLAGSA